MLAESPELFLALFCLAGAAGIVDTMAGGGGLLVVPGLMAAGLDPVGAFATNKFQALFGTSSATFQFWRSGRVRLRDHAVPALSAFLGSISGAAALAYVNPASLKAAVPFGLISVAIILLVRPNLGDMPRKALLSRSAGAFTIIPLIGFYDGLLGPGTGTFFALGAVAILGATLDEATIQAKIYNFGSNFGGLLFLSANGHTAWSYGIVMAAGTLAGGAIGARLILSHGVHMIKPFVVAMSLAMSFRLLWQQGTIQGISRAVASQFEAPLKPEMRRYGRVSQPAPPQKIN